MKRIFAACLLAATACAAVAQNYPVRTVRWIVTYPPGGTTDVIGRIVAEAVGRDLKVSIVVDNRPGAGGILGMDTVAKAPADGSVYLVSDASLATAPSLYRNLPFDPVRDLRPVGLFATVPHILITGPATPAANLAELIALSHRRNAEGHSLNFASGGLGSPLHLSGEAVRAATGIEWTHIPYKGAAPAVLAVVSGEADVATPSSGTVLQQIAGGRVRALAVTSEKRLARLPGVPTFAELGFGRATMSGWVGLHAPAATPAEPMKQMEAAVARALADPAVQARLEDQGAAVQNVATAAYGEFVAREFVRWKSLVDAAGLKPE